MMQQAAHDFKACSCTTASLRSGTCYIKTQPDLPPSWRSEKYSAFDISLVTQHRDFTTRTYPHIMRAPVSLLALKACSCNCVFPVKIKDPWIHIAAMLWTSICNMFYRLVEQYPSFVYPLLCGRGQPWHRDLILQRLGGHWLGSFSEAFGHLIFLSTR